MYLACLLLCKDLKNSALLTSGFITLNPASGVGGFNRSAHSAGSTPYVGALARWLVGVLGPVLYMYIVVLVFVLLLLFLFLCLLFLVFLLFFCLLATCRCSKGSSACGR